MANIKYKRTEIKAVKIDGKQVPDDVLERISGYEILTNEGIDNDMPILVYEVSRLKRILTNKKDDTNETTKIRIEKLYEQIIGNDLLIIENIT